MNKTHKIKLSVILSVVLSAIVLCVMIPINLGLDLQGGTQLVLEAKNNRGQTIDTDVLQGIISVIRNRIDGLGISEPIISQKGLKQISIELPGVSNPDHAVRMIGETALLEFVEAEWLPPKSKTLSKEDLEAFGGPNARIGSVPIIDPNGTQTDERPILLKQTVMTGADLKLASPGNDNVGNHIVQIEFTDKGAKKFQAITQRNIGRPLAIILDNKVISAPNINEEIAGGRAQISGHFTINEMKDLVIKLKAGALPVPVDIVSRKIVGPSLGKDSIQRSKVAGVIGTIAVISFMVFIYRKQGVAAAIALMFYIIISLAALKLINATLTLPGLAGFLLTIGIAVDANVLIFERIKEEKAAGQSEESAVQNGFSRAMVSILDSNITTLIAAAALFALGTGSLRGFAVTLSIGILVSMFTAITVTRVILDTVALIGKRKTS